jgi:hypothetical protein
MIIWKEDEEKREKEKNSMFVFDTEEHKNGI